MGPVRPCDVHEIRRIVVTFQFSPPAGDVSVMEGVVTGIGADVTVNRKTQTSFMMLQTTV